MANQSPKPDSKGESSETEPRAQEAHPRTTNPAPSARDLARVATSNPDQRDGEEALRAGPSFNTLHGAWKLT